MQASARAQWANKLSTVTPKFLLGQLSDGAYLEQVFSQAATNNRCGRVLDSQESNMYHLRMQTKPRAVIVLIVFVSLSLAGQYARAHAPLDAAAVQTVQGVADSVFNAESFAPSTELPKHGDSNGRCCHGAACEVVEQEQDASHRVILRSHLVFSPYHDTLPDGWVHPPPRRPPRLIA